MTRVATEIAEPQRLKAPFALLCPVWILAGG